MVRRVSDGGDTPGWPRAQALPPQDDAERGLCPPRPRGPFPPRYLQPKESGRPRNGERRDQNRCGGRQHRRLHADVPADGADPRVRGSGQPAVPVGEDAGPDAYVLGRGGGGRGHLRGAAHDRQDHLYAPRPRPLRRQGRGFQADVLRAAGQGRGLLPRQGRVDAHRRPVERQPRRQRHRRRVHGDRHRIGAVCQAARDGRRHGLFLRRRRDGAGPDVRGHEHGRPVEACR